MNIRNLSSILIQLLNSGLTGEPADLDTSRLEDEDAWRDLLAFAEKQDVVTMLSAGLSASGINAPDEIRQSLQKYVRFSEMRLQRGWDQLRPIVSAFERQSIDVIALKGPVLAERYYPAANLRGFSDLDIFVRSEQRDDAAAALVEVGYRRTPGDAYEDDMHKMYFCASDEGSRRYEIELHWQLTTDASPVLIPVDEIWSRSRLIECPAGPLRVIGREDEVIYLATHASRHLFHVPLRHQMDFAALLRGEPGLNWDECFDRAEVWGASLDLASALATAQELKCVTLPAPVSERCLRILASNHLSSAELATNAVDWPSIDVPYRFLDILLAPSPAQFVSRLREFLFPRDVQVHADTVQKESIAPRSYLSKWSGRASRWSGMILKSPSAIRHLSTTLKLYRRLRKGATTRNSA